MTTRTMDDIETAPEPVPVEYQAVDPSLIGTKEDASAPKRRGRPPRDPNAPPRPRGRPRGKKSLEDGIGGMLIMSNILFGFMPQPWRDDAFSENEIIALSKALDTYAQDHARVYKYLSTIVGGGSSSTIQLAIVLGTMGVRRLENHGITVTDLMGITKPKDTNTDPIGQAYSDFAKSQGIDMT